jgi:hypothetical protein
MDWSLVITIGLIFLITLIGAYVRSTIKDPCLKSFVGFHVTLERLEGKVVWGVLHLESTGLELQYLDSVQDEKHIESTYVLYSTEYPSIQAIYRYADNLSEWGRKKRAADIQRSFHPSALKRWGRSVRNFLSTATDSLNEVLGVVLGRIQKTGGRYLADKGDVALGKLSGKVLGQVGGGFDPLLERYIGQRVVIELLEGTEVHEHVGILKNYSPDFLEVLNVQYPQRKDLSVTPGKPMEAGAVLVDSENCVLKVENRDEQPLLLRSVQRPDGEQLLNVIVDGGQTVELNVGLHLEGAQLRLQIVRELDMIVPRSRCLVRHRAEHYQPEALSEVVADIIFDLGVALSPDSRRQARVTRLREQLAGDPKNALAAANMAGLLIQDQSFDEAETWLRTALGMADSLPDSGRRARMQLRELERAKATDGAPRNS